MRVITLIPDGAGETFTVQPDATIMGVFASLGRAIVTTDPAATIAGVFSFPAAKIQVTDLIAVTEKVYLPVEFQVTPGQQVFVTLESSGPFMLFLANLPDSIVFT